MICRLHVSGYITSFGSLEWAKTHDAETQTSPVVSALVDGGAVCVGKTVIDEMAYSIHGENKHFDTPTNPAAPDRVPGGCSSGSAVAVAGGMVDFALGEPFFSLFVEFLDSLCVHCTFLSAALLLLAFLAYFNFTRITSAM